MLPSVPSFERLALSRVTFGARPEDIATVREKVAALTRDFPVYR